MRILRWTAMLATLLAGLCVVGCYDSGNNDGSPTPGPTSEPTPADQDADGFRADEDCDDSRPEVWPGADEVCDDLDNDCDGEIDEDLVFLNYYRDADGDGYGDGREILQACEAPDGYVLDNSDCDDSRDDAYPAAEELCNGLDDDCDHEVDEGLMTPFYPDLDGDGFALSGSTDVVMACDTPENRSALQGDCDDTDAGSHPMLVDPVAGTSDGDGTPGAPLDIIWSALDSLGSCRVVLLEPGTYDSGISIVGEEDITIRGLEGPESTRIQTSLGERALYLEEVSDVRVEGVTLEASDPVYGSGAAALIFGSSEVTLDNVVLEKSEIEIELQGGGGLAVMSSTGVTVSRATFSRNRAQFGGALAVDTSDVSVSSCLFQRNEAGQAGGAIIVGNSLDDITVSSVTIEDSTFLDNSAEDQGGAILVELGHQAVVSDSYFEGNQATSAFGMGGAAYNPTEVIRCQFLENKADYGGALYLRAMSTVQNSIFWENSGDQAGGAVHVNDSTTDPSYIALVNNTMINNKSALTFGASLYLFDVDDMLVRNNIMVDFVSLASNFYSVETQADVVSFDHNDIYSFKGDALTGLFNDYAGVLGSDGNISTNPKFVLYDEESYENSDFHLAVDSPCRNTGNPSVGLDVDGTAPDMGAYGGPEAMTGAATPTEPE